MTEDTINLIELQRVLNALRDARIDAVVLDPVEGGGTIVRGVDKNVSALVFSTIETTIAPLTMSIHSVTVMLKRLALFDLSKASVEYVERGAKMHRMTIKQGRRKIGYTFSDHEKWDPRVPKRVTDSPMMNIGVSIEEMGTIYDAISSLGPDNIYLVSDGEKVTVEMSDGIDTFSDVILDHDEGHRFRFMWMTDAFKRLTKMALEESEEIELSVGQMGLLMFNIQGLDFLIAQNID